MKILFLLTLICCVAVQADAQSSNAQSQLTLKRLNTIGTQTSVDQIAPEGKVVGTPYLYDNWSAGTIVFTDGMVLENYSIRYDIRLNQLEIKVDNEIKGTSGKLVKEFRLLNFLGVTETYGNASQFKLDGTPVGGFVQVISTGKVQLVKRTELTIKKPDYSVQFNVGSRDTELIKKSELYFVKDNELTELPKSSKKFAAFFADQSQQVKAFMEEKDLGTREVTEVKEIVDYYNSL